MLLEIAVEGDGRDLVSLRDWLLATPRIRQSATVALKAPAATRGTMGSAAELITVAVNVTAALGTVLSAVVAWRQSRRHQITVTIRRAYIEVTVTGTDRTTIEQALRQLENGEP
ncbi:effector-associated constant component EACC1 [Actinoplanes couchii]|uniref:Uncharacterized protein n=1 Tax=Actinoplanes couchii TaxID=403638 RepID=A0ABQ3X6W1_9ACTN|nr:hypothetical protein [Actinoplanes couchii]MDR6322081.1 hypothetical protein [Actinoplanes couchii]GID54245.1 hypothetical protein Aco03nite_026490 [Actinoplanes couchii]